MLVLIGRSTEANTSSLAGQMIIGEGGKIILV
jgi:hypothetical protein